MEEINEIHAMNICNKWNIVTTIKNKGPWWTQNRILTKWTFEKINKKAWEIHKSLLYLKAKWKNFNFGLKMSRWKSNNFVSFNNLVDNMNRFYSKDLDM